MATWKTGDLPEHEQFSYWREVLCEAYIALNPKSNFEGQGFQGAVTAHLLSSVNVTTISSAKQEIVRGRSEISRMPKEVYFLNLQVRGQCRMMQGGREALISPGEFALVDSTEPYVNDYITDDWVQHSFRIPRHILRPHLLNPDRATGVRYGQRGGIDAVAVDFLNSLTRNVEGLAPCATQLSASMIELIAMVVGATDETRESGRKSMQSALHSSLLKYIDLNIADPDLSPAKAAHHFGVSTRYVHKALETGGQTFGRIMLERRLERCARELAQRNSGSISDIALRWGFNDLSHFSRVFRHQFNLTPREYRFERLQAGTDLLIGPT